MGNDVEITMTIPVVNVSHYKTTFNCCILFLHAILHNPFRGKQQRDNDMRHSQRAAFPISLLPFRNCTATVSCGFGLQMEEVRFIPSSTSRSL